MAIEKKAVERAIRPAWRPGAGSLLGSSPGSKASAARRAASAASVLVAVVARSSPAGVWASPNWRLSRYSRRPPGAGRTPARALDMANIASQKKRILRSERERTENRLLTSTVKTHFRRLESAVEGGDATRSRASSRRSSRRSTRPCKRAPCTGTPGLARRPKPRGSPPAPPRSSSGRDAGRSPEGERQRQLVAVVGATAAPKLEVGEGLGRPRSSLDIGVAQAARPVACAA